MLEARKIEGEELRFIKLCSSQLNGVSIEGLAIGGPKVPELDLLPSITCMKDPPEFRSTLMTSWPFEKGRSSCLRILTESSWLVCLYVSSISERKVIFESFAKAPGLCLLDSTRTGWSCP